MKTEPKQVAPVHVLSRRDRLTIPQIPGHSGPAIDSLFEVLKRQNVKPAGSLIYIYHGCDGTPTTPFDLEICVPVPADAKFTPGAQMELKSTSPFKCVATDYVGSMTGIGESWMKFVQSICAAGQKPTDQSREIYKKWIAFDSPDNVTELQQGVE